MACSKAAINLPVNENLAFRVAGFHSQEDGYVNNVFKPTQNNLIAHDNSGGRVSTRYQKDTIDVNFMIEYEHREQSGSMYRATEKGATWETWLALFPDIGMPNDNRNISSNMGLGEEDNSNIWSYNLQVDWDLDFATLTSQTGYKDHEYVYAEDFDAMSVAVNDYAQDQKGTYFEQEFRLVSHSADAFSWYAGVSYYQEDIEALFSQHADEDAMCVYYYAGQTCAQAFPGFTYSPVGLLESNRDKGEYNGWAAYVDLSYAFNELFDASLGVRYTYDEKKFKIERAAGRERTRPVLGDGVHHRRLSERHERLRRIHAARHSCATTRATTGWHSQASRVATSRAASAALQSRPISRSAPSASRRRMRGPIRSTPKRCGRTRLGAKGEVYDGRIRIAANVYYYTYEDLQVNVPGTSGGIVVDNVGKVDGWGLEGTLEWIATDNLDLYLAGAYGDTEAEAGRGAVRRRQRVRRKAVAAGAEVLRLGGDQRAFPGARRRHRLFR